MRSASETRSPLEVEAMTERELRQVSTLLYWMALFAVLAVIVAWMSGKLAEAYALLATIAGGLLASALTILKTDGKGE